jgi:hypothetical protein
MDKNKFSVKTRSTPKVCSHNSFSTTLVASTLIEVNDADKLKLQTKSVDEVACS